MAMFNRILGAAAMLVLILPATVISQAGETGLAFLKIGSDARTIAMGEAGVSTANDAASAYWNPGLLPHSAGGVVFTHNEWIQDVNYDFFAAKFQGGLGHVAVQVLFTGVSGIEHRVIPSDEPISVFDSHDFAAGLSYGRNITDELSAGVTLKYAYEKIFDETVHGLGLDVGAVFDLGARLENPLLNNRLVVAAAIKNIGRTGDFGAERVGFPANVRVGVSYDAWSNPAKGDGLQIAVEEIKYFEDNFRTNCGAEYRLRDLVFLRAGYQFGYDARSYSVGIGLKTMKKIKVDYAFVPFDNDLGSPHIFTVGFDF